MDEIRIEDLPDGGIYQGSDRFPLQRLESGVWNDYQTNFDQYFGEVMLAVFDWDMSASLYETITAGTPGNYLILMNAWAVFVPGTVTPGTGATISIYNTGNPISSYSIDFVIGADSYGCIAYPLVDPITNNYDSLDTPIVLDLAVAPGIFDSSMRIYVQYIELQPI